MCLVVAVTSGQRSLVVNDALRKELDCAPGYFGNASVSCEVNDMCETFYLFDGPHSQSTNHGQLGESSEKQLRTTLDQIAHYLRFQKYRSAPVQIYRASTLGTGCSEYEAIGGHLCCDCPLAI
eukprot:3198248-Amphidinium_carterae.1